MTGVQFLFKILFVIHVCKSIIGKTEAVVWRSDQDVDYFKHYTSVTPVRFPVPRLTGEATWSFRATRSPDDCDHKTISVYLQFGSLPVVNPFSEMFPDHFYLERTELVHLNVTSTNVSVPHQVLLPRGGDWYAVAFIPERNDQITQKGLTQHCHYKFSASMEVKELPPHLYLSVNQPLQVALTGGQGDGMWVGFKVPVSSQAVEVKVKDCSLDACEMQLSTATEGRTVVENCSRVENRTCGLRLPSPLVGYRQFVRLQLLTAGNATVLVEVTSDDCQPALEQEQEWAQEQAQASQSCFLERELDRYQKPDDFSIDYVRLENNTVQSSEFVLSNDSMTVVPFVVERTTDIGGTLKVNVTLKKEDVVGDQQVRVCGQVMNGRFPSSSDDLDLCSNVTNSVQVNSSAEGSGGHVSGELSVPYPEEGVWTMALGIQCYNATNSSAEVVECSNGTQRVTLTVKIQSCVDEECSGNGDCKEFIKGSDFIVFSACVCAAGWRGYGCTDGREALSDSSQLVEVLLLTLSNLFFLPAIIVAAYRRHYLEAVVYFYNMFFSAFYHACDGDRVHKYIYCMTHFSVLATGDFLASTVSLWVTLIAMMQIPVGFTSAIQMAGPLALIIGVLLDRTSLWVIAVPTGLGLALVVVCWVTQCCRTKRCFPERWRYVWMLPGVLFAVAGAIMFAFFETASNYKYIHSAWHVCLSLSIIFLLPPRRKEKVTTSVNFDDTESTEGLVLGPNNYTRRMNFEL